MPPFDLNTDALVLIVVGAHPRGERDDRPQAYRLRDRISAWIDAQPVDDRPLQLEPFVVTDLWYLNDESLRGRPVVSIGDPEFNACTAYFANRLPEAFVIDGSLRIQLDLEFAELRACLWGTSPSATGSAVELFIERYMEAFLRAAHEAGS